jgi:hypothetical protein
MDLANRQPEGRVYTEKIYIVTTLIACGYLVHPLANYLD